MVSLYNMCQIYNEIAVEKEPSHGVLRSGAGGLCSAQNQLCQAEIQRQVGHLHCCNGHHLSDSAADVPAGCKANQRASAI